MSHAEFLFDMQSYEDSENGYDISDTTDFDCGGLSSFEEDLDDVLKDVSLFDWTDDFRRYFLLLFEKGDL